MASVDQTLTTFFSVLNPASNPNVYQNLTTLMQQFVPVTNNLPWIGIAKYGPQFQGSAVRTLFRQLFISFPDCELAEVAPRFYLPNNSPYGVGIAVQTTLSGSQQSAWFQQHGYASPPISNIVPDGVHSMSVDACAVFLFDPQSFLIAQFSLYFDRYSMAQQLTPPTSGR
jgi:hypothetical protein